MKDIPWIVLVTHSKLGYELVRSAEMMMGKMKNVKTISLMPGESPEDLYDIVKTEMDNISNKALILTDLFGGTPSNVSSFFAKRGYFVMAGVNLPILLEAELFRNRDDWDNILSYLEKIGKDSIINVTNKISRSE